MSTDATGMTGRTEAAEPARRRAPPFGIAPELYPFATRFVDAAGARVHMVDEGAGPPVLMLHGNPTWSFLWRGVIRALRGEARRLAPDLPGFRLSPAPSGYGFSPAEHARVVEAVVLALDLRDLTLAMQDWGGPIGLWVAGRHPERIRALAVGNSWAWPVNGDIHFEAFAASMGGAVGRWAIRRCNLFVNLLIPLGCARRKPEPEVMAAYRAPFRSPDSRTPTHVFPRAITGARDFLAAVEAGLAALRDTPAVLMWGDRDPAFRAKERDRFAALLPNHRRADLRGAGHFIQEDAPEEIAAAVRGVLGARAGMER